MESEKFKFLLVMMLVAISLTLIPFINKNPSVDEKNNMVCELKSDFKVGELSFNKFSIKSNPIENKLKVELDNSLSLGTVKLYDHGENISASSPFYPMLTTMGERTMKYIESKANVKGRFKSVKVFGSMLFDGLVFHEVIFVNAVQNGKSFKYLYNLDESVFGKCS